LAITMLKNGDLFQQYRILEHLARGGTSDIYRAEDTASGGEVVLKIPDAAMIGDPAQFERFQRELGILNQLRHPAIQKGIKPGQNGRIPFLVAEMVNGRSLREIIDHDAPLPPGQAVDTLRKIAEGVAYCHSQGVIHRDLKPENVLVTPEGQPIIIDFGLALTSGGRRVTYPNFSGMAGTPEYMAPEQVEGKRGDARTDIYALGVILYEMLAGHPPFQADTPVATMGLHLYGKLQRLDRVRPGVPTALAAIAGKCLQRNPEKRFATVDELLLALAHPESVDPAILDDEAGDSYPIWKNPYVIGTITGVLVLVGLALLALFLQNLRPH
jgi:serine/threonine protein kinase